MPSPTALLRQCLAAAANAAGPMLGRCAEHAVGSLQEAENKSGKVAERHEIADAWRELLRHKAGWVARFPGELATAFKSTLAPGALESMPAPLGTSRLDSLTLVDDTQLMHSIESSRLTQLVLPVVEQPLAELDGLVSGLLGLPAVRPEQNPLRPDVIAQVLRGLMADAPPQQSALWLRHLATPLGRELDKLYRELVQRLKDAQVQAATYRVLPSAPSPSAARPATGAGTVGMGGSAGAGGVGGGGGGAGEFGATMGPGTPAVGAPAGAAQEYGSAWADLSGLQVSDALVQDFLWRGGQQHQAPLAPAYYARVDQELAALAAEPPTLTEVFDPGPAQQWRHLPAVDRPRRHVGVDSPLPGETWGAYAAPRQRAMVRSQLKRRAEHVGQAIGLEVVRKLVHQVAQDGRLLAPVREAIVALEPTLLRLAMVDPRFFGKEEHPARRLVERVAERSFKYNDEFSSEFQQFADSVAAVIKGLNAQELERTEPVEQALAGLEADWKAQDDLEAQRQAEVLDAMQFAERRQAEADQIAWELSQRPDLDNVPAIVQDFLFNSWSLVMAHARLVDGRRHIDPGGFGAVVTDLLWSVKREVTLRQPARLIEMIPGLLECLRNGLAALGQDARENDSFFAALEKLHRPVLKLRAKRRQDTLDSAAMPLESAAMPLEAEDDMPAGVAAQQPRPADELWLGRGELDAAGFQDTLPSDHAELVELREQQQADPLDMGEADAQPVPDGGVADIDPALLVAGLREGCWVDLYSKRRWLRARLIWASTKGTLFMFTSHGGQPHSMTRRSMERLIRERLLRPVDMQGVVDHALATLGQNAPAAPDAETSQSQALAA